MRPNSKLQGRYLVVLVDSLGFQLTDFLPQLVIFNYKAFSSGSVSLKNVNNIFVVLMGLVAMLTEKQLL